MGSLLGPALASIFVSSCGTKLCLDCPDLFKSSPPDVFLGKDVLKICSKFTGEHLCGSGISIKLL